MKKNTKNSIVLFALFFSILISLPFVSYSYSNHQLHHSHFFDWYQYHNETTSTQDAVTEQPVDMQKTSPETTAIAPPENTDAIPSEEAIKPTAVSATHQSLVAPVPSILQNAALNLSGTANKQLQKLNVYQNTFDGFVADRLMVFVNMPQTSSGIKSSAKYIAQTSTEFAKHGVTPVFIMEPSDEQGALLNLKKIANGDYRKNLDKLFSEIKRQGAIEKNLGIFVPYPEVNTSAWNRKNFTPEDFPGMVNDFFSTAKKYYPNIQGSLLLDSKTYPVDDINWEHGALQSFTPYITGISSEHIQSFGLQGFPWAGEHGQDADYDAQTFLPANLATQAATILNTKSIWFNTGTFREMYAIGNTPVSPPERTQIFQTIFKQADIIIAQGFTIWMNIFAENKMNTDEKTDWSYLDAKQNNTFSEHELVFKNFINEIRNRNIALSLFE